MVSNGLLVSNAAPRPCAPMLASMDAGLRDEINASLRNAGARFAFLHGSRTDGTHRPGSDVDVAAWWAREAPSSFEVPVPVGVDLLVLNDAPLEFRGRVAVGGVLLFDDDPPARVQWVATTRKVYFDEQPRMLRAHREFAEGRRRGR